MKIGVNGRFLTKPFTGIGQYTINVLRELAKITPDHEYIVVVPEKVDFSFPKNVRVRILNEKKVGTPGMRKTWWEQVQVLDYFKKEEVEKAFFPYPSCPWTRDWYKKFEVIVAVHDCIPWVNKEYLRGVLSQLYHSQSKKAVRYARKVLTVSEFSKKELVEIIKVREKKVFVAHNDAGKGYKKEMDEAVIAEVLEEFELKKEKFFLYVGGYDSRKNVAHLLEEYDLFCRYHGKDVKMVLAGGSSVSDKLYRSYMKEVAVGEIIRTGFLEEKKLAALYRSCRGFVNFSKQEGFNIPILEAANCGAPIVISDIKVHREVAQKNAAFINLKKHGAGKRVMLKLMDDEYFDKMRGKALDLAKEYSWSSSANIIKDVIFS